MLYAGEDEASQKRARAARNLRQVKLRLSQACLEPPTFGSRSARIQRMR